jgi:tetratricopeptide (TPR) repeat protein
MAESRSFSQAAARWHRDHDASTALAALDAHERLFPRGQMQTETLLLRGEILLQLGREQESLALLDRLPLAELPRGRELLTVRGELRVKYGRCPEARRDLDRVLSRNRGDALARRAARALALCP